MFTPPHLLEPRRWQNLRIGLFGGSFNPPHAGHLHVAHTAMKRLDLDFVWWMVTPQNPLKRANGMASFDRRMEWSKDIVDHPRIIVSDIERQIGTHVSIDTVRTLKSRFPKTDFVWLCGTDNAQILHKWDEWRKLLEEIEFCFVARPPALKLVKNLPVKMLHPARKDRIHWIYDTKMVDQSSTELRALL